MSITWPVAALLYCWWRSGKISKRQALTLTPLLLVAFPLVFINSLIGVAKPIPIAPFSWAEKIILVGRNFAFYVGKLLWPLEHVPIYPKWDVNPQHVVLFIFPVAIALILTTLWFLRQRIGRGPFAAVAFYLLTLSPILGLISWGLLALTYVQDHYQYLACIGPFLLLGYAFDKLAMRFSYPKLYAVAVPVLILPLMFVAHQQVLLYRDTETLFAENYRLYPNAAYGATQYAAGLVANNKFARAYPVVEHAVRLDPRSPENLRLKGKVLYGLNQAAEARAIYEQALGIQPNDENTIIGYATIVLNSAPADAAKVIPLLQGAAARNPQNFANYCLLGDAFYLSNQFDEALRHFELAERLGSLPPESLYYHARILLERGEKEKAIALLREACAKAPLPKYQEALRTAAQ